jgi:hypothetical protein
MDSREKQVQDSQLPHARADRTPLTAESLAEGLGPQTDLPRDGLRALCAVLAAANQPGPTAAFSRWRQQVAGAYGHDIERASPVWDALADCYGLRARDLQPAEVLFALHTYYALSVKLLVWQILGSAHGLSTPASRLSRVGSGSRLRQEVRKLEAGDLLPSVDLAGSLGDDLFSWYVDAWHESIEAMVRRLVGLLGRYDAHAVCDDPAGSRDLFKRLYESLFPAPVRHMLGEYYTPDWLAEHVLDGVGYEGQPDARLLDPACGSGTFLVLAIRRMRASYDASRPQRHAQPGELCRKILTGVVGFDLNPLAVLSARANYLIAICDLLRHVGRVEVPVYSRDSILTRPEGTGPAGRPFDYIVGNPPWIAWDDLPDDYRQRSKPLWHRYGLFSLSGSDARHGGGKKDLSMLMLYAACDRYLKPRGRLGMVVTQTLFQTKGAGDGFRRFRLGGGEWLRVLRVDDLVEVKPFPGVANWTAAIVLQKGAPTEYPVPYVKWSLEKTLPESEDDGRFRLRQYQAQPIDPERSTSPWLLRPEGLKTDWARLVGPSDYQAHLGANSGGANGVYWLTVLGERDGGVAIRNIPGRGKRQVDSVEQVVEPDLLYPLLRWADVARYRAEPKAHLLLAQDVDTRRGIDEALMRRRYPKTHAYLSQFAPTLRKRAAYKRYQQDAAFYSMYNVGRYTVAPIKVVWRRMDRQIRAAVVREFDDPVLGPRPVIPQETCVLIPAQSADEAHYLCAVLNSSVVGFLVTSHSVRGGKGFGSPSMLDFLRLRRFEPDNSLHRELTASSREAHQAVCQGEALGEIQQQIDRLAARLWELSDGELDVIGRELDAGLS